MKFKNMKKLLSLLSVLTISGTVVPSIIATSPYQKQENNKTSNSEKLKRIKRQDNENIPTNDFLEFNNKSINKIFVIDEDVFNIITDNKNNVYFIGNKKIYVLKQGETTPVKIEGIKDSHTIKKNIKPIIDSKDNVYFGTDNGIYVLKQGAITATKLKNITNNNILTIAIDSNDNIYFGTDNNVFILKKGETKPDIIKETNNLFINQIVIDKNSNFIKFFRIFFINLFILFPHKYNGGKKKVEVLI